MNRCSARHRTKGDPELETHRVSSTSYSQPHQWKPHSRTNRKSNGSKLRKDSLRIASGNSSMQPTPPSVSVLPGRKLSLAHSYFEITPNCCQSSLQRLLRRMENFCGPSFPMQRRKTRGHWFALSRRSLWKEHRQATGALQERRSALTHRGSFPAMLVRFRLRR